MKKLDKKTLSGSKAGSEGVKKGELTKRIAKCSDRMLSSIGKEERVKTIAGKPNMGLKGKRS